MVARCFWALLRYKFSDLNFISSLTKIPTQAHKLFWTHINIPHNYYLNIIHVIRFSQILHTQAHNIALGPLTNIIHYILHIIQLEFPTKNTHHVTTKIGPQNYTISIKSPNPFDLWAKPKSPTKPSYKVCYNAASLKPTTVWQCFTKFHKTQKLIWHLFSQSLNANLASIFIKPKC